MIEELRKDIKAYLEKNSTNANKVALCAGIDPALLYRFIKGERTNLTLETAEKIRRVISEN